MNHLTNPMETCRVQLDNIIEDYQDKVLVVDHYKI
jgi:hypothetical protein